MTTMRVGKRKAAKARQGQGVCYTGTSGELITNQVKLLFFSSISLLERQKKSMRATPSELRNDMLLQYQGEWYRILEFYHGSKAQARAFIRAKLKHLRTGEEREIRLRAGEEIELVPGEHRPCDYLYPDGEDFVFLNPVTFEEVAFPPERFGEARRFLKRGNRRPSRGAALC
jgi:translation elongation factor P/translation initiation factor 5A